MHTAEQLLATIIQWAEAEQLIRALLLQGSRARLHYDELADIDVSVFADTYKPYLQNDRWLSIIGDV